MEESSWKVLEASCLGLRPCSTTQRLCKLFLVWASISFPATRAGNGMSSVELLGLIHLFSKYS